MSQSRIFVLPFVLWTLGVWAGRGQAAVMFDWAVVGNAGNAADSLNSVSVPGIGSVGYEYRIAKHEVTNAQYAEFLNAVDPTGTNPNAVYNSFMGSSANGGINFSAGNANGSKYSTKTNQGNQPVIFVSWNDSARFTNWLHNGQGAGSSETGVYTMSGATTLSGERVAGAKYFIPTENEWYKAAYHKNDGMTGNYFLYATGSDSVPVSNQPGNPLAVNYFNDDGIANGFNDGFAVTGSTFLSSTQSYLTDVGAYTLVASPYGTFDQNGNVFEWNETRAGFSSRVFRGGSWISIGELDLQSFGRGGENPQFDAFNVGFRVATVIPEPGTIVVLAFGGAVVVMRGGRRRV